MLRLPHPPARPALVPPPPGPPCVQGLLEPPPPKVKISNLMRVMGEKATAGGAGAGAGAGECTYWQPFPDLLRHLSL